MSFDYASAQYASGDRYCERYLLGEGAAPLERPIDLPATHIRVKPRGAALRFHGFVTGLLRAAARALYLFPVLVVVKIVLFLMGNTWSDYITVGFVVLVVVFFALFALTILSYAIVGPRSKRVSRTTVVFEPPQAGDLDAVVAAVAPGASTRVTGRVEAGLPQGERVLMEQWLHGDHLARFVSGRSFAVIPDDAASMPCIVEITGSPIFVARYSDVDEDAGARAEELSVMSTLKRDASERAPMSRCALVQGQRVTVVAHRSEAATHVGDRRLLDLLSKGDSAEPYRGGESPGIVIRATPYDPVVIQILDEP